VEALQSRIARRVGLQDLEIKKSRGFLEMHFAKKILIFAIIVAAFYFLLGYHYIVIDRSVKMLKKSEFTLEYTVFSTKGKTMESVLSVPELWNDGIGELLLKEGKISEEQLEMYKDKLEYEKYNP
jgi:hypothetical protein